jgi:hypothetical protein
MLLCKHSSMRKKEKNMGENGICPYIMENGWNCMDSNVPCWFVFYLECDKGT